MFDKKSNPIITDVVASVAASPKTVAKKRACLASTKWWQAFENENKSKKNIVPSGS